MGNLELTNEEMERLQKLPEVYWASPLCIVTLMRAHGEGRIEYEATFNALKASGLVDYWPEIPGMEGRVTTTEKGRLFVEMILATPLPEQRWVDPRSPVPNVGR